ncbi:MAG: hypothetical protein H6502_03385 [Candidatus Woesearchaeota archaeon]|nr:MAG: hypothetical protein H6502_03385 [Candidatus Woesearchaeota archaeon]
MKTSLAYGVALAVFFVLGSVMVFSAYVPGSGDPFHRTLYTNDIEAYDAGVVTVGDDLILSAAGGNKLGIGVLAPLVPLHIATYANWQGIRVQGGSGVGDSGVNALEIFNNNNQRQINIGLTDSTNTYPNTFFIYDATAGAYRLVVNDMGFVGVGTGAPLATLDVHGDIVFDDIAPRGQNCVGGDVLKNTAGSWVCAQDLVGINPSGCAAGQVAKRQGASWVCANDLVGGADTDWTESGNNVYKTTGNVGIGTNNPTVALDVEQGVISIKKTGLSGDYDSDGSSAFQEREIIIDPAEESGMRIIETCTTGNCDCDDHNAFVHPGQTAWTNNPANNNGGDVNCNNQVDLRWSNQAGDCHQYHNANDCDALAGWFGGPPACGQTSQWKTELCEWDGSTCNGQGAVLTIKIQECR